MKTWVHSLVQRMSLASGRLPPVCHNYWSPSVLEPVLHKINPCNEKPTHCNWKIAPDQQNSRKLACKKERTASSWGEKKHFPALTLLHPSDCLAFQLTSQCGAQMKPLHLLFILPIKFFLQRNARLVLLLSSDFFSSTFIDKAVTRNETIVGSAWRRQLRIWD